MRKKILIALAVVVALPLLAVAALFAIRETPDGPRVEAAPGSVMYLYKDVLFTGDSLMRKKGGVDIVPSLSSEDSERNRGSLRALQPLVFEKVADGHAGVTRDAKKKLARFLASL